MFVHFSERGWKRGKSPCRAQGQAAFTLVELLTSVVILALLMTIIASVTNQTASTLRSATAQIDASQAGRAGFDLITQKLAQATLNTYWDYDSPTTPTKYIRKSDLNFVIKANAQIPLGIGQAVYFQAPAAFSENQTYGDTQGLLNSFGYFVQYGSDDNFRPAIITKKRWRFRLMQGMQPTESLALYSGTGLTGNTWTTAVDSTAWPIADNVIGLIVWPRETVSDDPLGTAVSTNYLYDSRSTANNIQYAQIAPVIQVTLIMIDEATATRLDTGSSTPPTQITNAFQGSPFTLTGTAQYQTDLNKVQAALAANHINYQVLTTTVTMRESKWSSSP